jgi:DNA polymerase
MNIPFADQLIDEGLPSEAVSKVVTDMASYYNRLHTLGSKITECTACPLSRGCKAAIAGIGPLRPEVLVVSNFPLLPSTLKNQRTNHGMNEVVMFMMLLFSRVGLTIEDIYWTHAVKCPTNRARMADVKNCLPHLVNEIAMLEPAVIVTLGSTALSALAGESLSIEDAIGTDVHFEAGAKQIPVIPLYHPSSVIDSGDLKSMMQEMWESIKSIKDFL